MNSVMFRGVENPLQRSEVTDQLKSSHTDKRHYVMGLKGTGVFMNHFITHIHRLSRSITSLLVEGDMCEMCCRECCCMCRDYYRWGHDFDSLLGQHWHWTFEFRTSWRTDVAPFCHFCASNMAASKFYTIHLHPEQISKQVSWRLVRESRMSLQQTLATEYRPHFVFPDFNGVTVALNLKLTVKSNPV